MNETTIDFISQIQDQIKNASGNKNQNIFNTISYSTARETPKEYTIAAGIGAGGIIVHLFKIGEQETAIIHIDANNATPDVRSSLITLGENLGLDRTEISTSDTHAVVRILSSQGYYPLGTKVSAEFIVEKVKELIIKARKSFTPVEIANKISITPGFRFWGNISFFELILETIERCLTVSKVLLTIGLFIPTLITLVLTLFFY
jgi:predicted neutral ceramidase superfamily lipid hydrolase